MQQTEKLQKSEAPKSYDSVEESIAALRNFLKLTALAGSQTSEQELVVHKPILILMARVIITSLAELNHESRAVIGLYGKVYAEIVAIATHLISERNISAQVVYEIFAPVIVMLRDSLQTSRAAMPLMDFENLLRGLGWRAPAIYTTTVRP